MAVIKDKVIIDMIPIINNGDMRKIFDYGIVKFNQIILSLFNQLQIPKGTLTDFPNVGCAETLLAIHFSEDASSAEHEIRENIKVYQKYGININLLVDENDRSNVNISIDVDGVPNYRYIANILKNQHGVRIINPDIIKLGEV